MKFTTEKVAAFCAALSETCNVSRACKAVGISRMAAYNWRRDDPVFAARWDDAMKAGLMGLEDEAHRRAFEGDTEDVYNKDGAKVGTKRKYSDTLAIFLLKAHDPNKYRENQKIELSGPNDGPIEISQTQRAARLATLFDRLKSRTAPPDDGSDLV